MKVEYEHLLLNENAYFYKLKRRLVKKDIELIFQECLKDKVATRKFESKIRESFVHGPKEIAKISIDIFEFRKRPSFLTDEIKGVFEIKYGLFVIIEVDDYVAIIRKNVSGVKYLNSVIEKLDYEILSRFLLKDISKYEKIVTNNMNAASNSMQRKVSEAEDIQRIFSRFGASKQILNSIRVDNEGQKSTVTINTSRVNSFNIQSDFTGAIVWIVDVIKQINLAFKSPPQSRFIDSFATPIKFRDKIEDLVPAYVLIRFGALKDEIESEHIKKCFYSGSPKKVDMVKDVFSKEILFELKESDEDTYENGEISVRVRKNWISVTVESFKDIVLDFGDDEISLNNYLNSNSHFIVVFDHFEFIYTQRMIFKDSKLLGDPTNFLNTFLTYDELAHVDSEKGKNYRTSSTQFQDKSIFYFVEQTLAKDSSYLICDDLGVEWGDFISIMEDEISFYHAKYNDKGLSATNLEAVFGQAQKNLGFLELRDEMIDIRKSRWQSNYRLGGVATSIKRMRKNPAGKDSIGDIKAYVNHVSSNPHVKRKIFIVVNFISKKNLGIALDLLTKGKTFVDKGVMLQILWFVNALLGSAHELGVELRIVCRP